MRVAMVLVADLRLTTGKSGTQYEASQKRGSTTQIHVFSDALMMNDMFLNECFGKSSSVLE
ncbi:MAG: hypothetical protein NPIRA02_41500 [Nitrospirales bacterium]|nr:MAG: hypothetical protein NPIRA02_41500 [Nitrospirales bacterium]